MDAKTVVPWSMAIFRALLGPGIVAVAQSLEKPEAWLATMIVLGLVSDIFDGILARRWQSDTGALRLADSVCDDIFYLGIAAVAVGHHWQAIRPSVWLLVAVLILEALRILCDWLKYGRMASYHSYAAKAWGVLLASSAVALICFDSGSTLLTLALAWGIACELEGLAMTALLPNWARDVKSISHALALRDRMLA
jgi:CDP-diacylglycerol--glycerol-3-phosphate 3-phosphatidyltransferase